MPEFWHVQMPNGSVSTMTLDDLDEAFQNGRVTEHTYVVKAGETQWATLGALLGGEEPAAPAPSPTPAPVAAPIATYTPAESAPVYSLRPVVSEIDDSELELGGSPFGASSKKKKVIAIASIGGVALAAALVAVLGSSTGGPAPAAKPAPVAAAAPPPAAAPAPPPAETATAAPERFTEAQKKALADADKTHATQAAQRAASRAAAAAAAAPRSTYKSNGKPVFHKGGNKYDPLNNSL